MNIYYIYHSGFAIELKDFTILIDYYKDSGQEADSGIVHDILLKNPGHLYVLSSHNHPDHFNPEILKWQEKKKNISYIFSKDISENKELIPAPIEWLDKGECYEDKNLRIKAYGSTDIGISFLIETGGKTIFHAGDLNNWHWDKESTPAEIEEAEADYVRELNALSDDTKEIDIVMFPVDRRLGENYARGALQFVDKIQTNWFFPMHFWRKYEAVSTLEPILTAKGIRYANIQYEGQLFTL